MKTFKKIGIACLILTMFAGCVINARSGKRRQNKIEGEAGRMVAKYSISIDAGYDARLDHLIKGRKTASVSIQNMSLNNIIMDAKHDRWMFESEKGKKYKATNSLRIQEPVLWRSIPDDLRDKIDYPEVVPINYSVTFNLFFPKNAKLKYFRKIRYYNAVLDQEFILDKYY